MANHKVSIGVSATCENVPVTGTLSGPIGIRRNLETSPKTAVSRSWLITQQPVGSNVILSDAFAPNPSFVPEEPGPYQIKLCATNATGDFCIRSLSLTATNAPLLSNTSYSNQVFSVWCRTKAGKTYTLEYRDFLSGGNWESATTAPGTGTKVQISDGTATTSGRAYRVLEQ